MPFKPIIYFRKLIYPNRCIVCNRICSDKYFCKDCNRSLTAFTVKLCPKCGAPKKHCTCKFNFYYFKEITCAFENSGLAKQSFYRFKFAQNLYNSNYFSENMIDFIKRDFNGIDFDYVTAIPMSRQKKYKRGYNQAEILAKKISCGINVKYVSLLTRNKYAQTQHKLLSYNERFLNVKDSFKVTDEKFVKGKTILLIDDIMTTGATLSEAARQLKLSGADEVYCATALKTISEKS